MTGVGAARTSSRPVRGVPVRALLVAACLLAACGQDSGTGTAEDAGDASLPAATEPSPTPRDTPTATAADVEDVLVRALTREHEAKATYDNVVAALGDVAPFSAVAPAQAQHIAELEQVARSRGVDVTGIAVVGAPAPSTLPEACRTGVATEQAVIALYDELLPQVAAQPDVEYVLSNLRSASLDNHLPAFERCA
ncbi:hypothetical protein ACI79C_09675 [Geodermatophilus sp. SYSU D00697]